MFGPYTTFISGIYDRWRHICSLEILWRDVFNSWNFNSDPAWWISSMRLFTSAIFHPLLSVLLGMTPSLIQCLYPLIQLRFGACAWNFLESLYSLKIPQILLKMKSLLFLTLNPLVNVSLSELISTYQLFSTALIEWKLLDLCTLFSLFHVAFRDRIALNDFYRLHGSCSSLFTKFSTNHTFKLYTN